MPLVVPDVCRFTVNQTYLRAQANIFDFAITPGASGLSRPELIQLTAYRLMDWWETWIIPNQSNTCSSDNISWVDLDSLTGTTGVISDSPNTDPWPVNGNNSGEGAPPNTSVLVTKVSGGGRATRNGRLYIGGLVEAQMVRGSLTSGALGDFAAAFDNFDSVMEGPLDDPDTGGRAIPVVVQVTERDANGNPTLGEDWPWDPSVVNSLLATQRRRLRP